MRLISAAASYEFHFQSRSLSQIIPNRVLQSRMDRSQFDLTAR
jgi:hypothetical protein